MERERNMKESLPQMKEAAEEHGAAWKRVSKESGFTGVSKLVTLYHLYGFDVLHDTVIDMMHNLPMNPVKKSLQRILNNGNININEIESRLSNLPWPPEMKASRYPVGFTSRLGYWKAEDYQKFAFPASEVILGGQIPEDEFHCWKILVQMTQMVFNCCRTSGWKQEDIDLFRNLAWRHNIMVEETFGLDACVITEHNLLHVADDIKRFSSPDNFWVYDLERAVKRYVSQSTNYKNIEKTFSNSEVRREVLQSLDIHKEQLNEILPQEELERALKCKQVSSLKKCNALISFDNQLLSVKDGIAVGGQSGFHSITNLQQQEILEDLNRNLGFHLVISKLPSLTKSCNSILKPGQAIGHPNILYRTGEDAMFLINNKEIPGRINKIHLLNVKDADESDPVHLFLEVQLYQKAVDDNGQVKCHNGTDSQYVQMCSAVKVINKRNLLRKAILYPEQSLHNHYVVIDFQSPVLPPHKQFVVIPFYPEKNDVVIVQGEDDKEWMGYIISVQKPEKKVGLYFLKEHPRWPGSKKFIKESSTIHNVEWNCIIKKLNGTWLANRSIWLLKDST